MTQTVPGRYIVLAILVFTATIVSIAAVMLFGHPRGRIAPPPSAAVLPIKGDTTGAVTSEIIDALKPIQGFEVADAALWANKRTDLRALGEKLNVRTVLDGSTDGKHVTIQLINAADSFELFTHTYDLGRGFKEALAHDVAAQLMTK
jgi:TolB-like protein